MEFGENWRTWYILEEVGEMNMTWIDTITVVISVLLGIGICFYQTVPVNGLPPKHPYILLEFGIYQEK